LQTAPAFVQVNFATPQAPALTVTVPFTAAQSAGNLNVVVVGWNDTAAAVASVSDTKGNGYLLAVGPTAQPGAITQSIYYAKNVAASPAGSNVVTVSFTAPAQFADVRILEYAGVDPANPLDVVASGTGSAATSSTPPVTTTNASDLLFAANTVASFTAGAGAGWTSRVVTSPDGDIAEDQVVTAAGAYSASATLTGPGAWVMQLVAFRAAASAPAPDTQPPTAPSNLTATAASSSRIDLSWTASTDNVGVTSYLVERCQGAGCSTFAQIATTPNPPYGDTGLSASTTYSYRVRASDAAGNLSAYSNVAAAATPSPPPPPPAIAFVQVNFATPQSPVATVSVPFTGVQSTGNLNVVVVGWNDATAQVTSLTDTKGNAYQLAVGPVSQGGAVTQSIYYAKNIAAAAAGANVVTVSFSAPAQFPDIRVLEYAGIDRVSPVDIAVSAGGATATSSTPPVATSGAPDLLFAANTVTSWTGGPGTGWTSRVITNPDGDIAEDRTVTAAGSYDSTAPLGAAGTWVMQMVAFRGAGSGGAPPPPDTQAPTNPSNLSATAASTSRIDLSWTASTDNVGVTGYLIERCQGAGCSTFAQIATSTATTYGDTGLTAAASYSYRVRATDAAGNSSGYSNTSSATTLAPPPPGSAIAFVQMNYATPQTPVSSVTVPFTAAQSAGNLSVVVVGWSDTTAQVASVSDTKGNSYQLAVGPTAQPGEITQSIYHATNIAAAAAGANAVTVSFTAAARFPDIRVLEYAGIDPINAVDVTASANGSTAISSTPPVSTTNASDLLFAANTVASLTTGAGSGWTSRVITSPDGDIAEDRVVAAPGSYDSTAPLSNAGGWVMQIVAFRGAGSGAPDTQPPTSPSNLAATATSASQINLSWTASADNVGVARYLIERCQGAGCSTFAQIVATASTAYGDSGLSASTAYSYRVRASDAAGNLSGYSNVAGATTASPPPPPPPPAASSNPLISRGLTTAGSPGSTTPSTSINDGVYGTFDGTWAVPRAAQPAWVALRVPAGPSKLLLSWVNVANFDWNFENEANYGSPGDYTIATSTDSTNGDNGTWTTVATVTTNLYSGREHAFPFPAAGGWVKMTITAMPNSNGVVTQNDGTLAIDEIDLHDATSGTNDTWLFLGDSITAFWANRINQPSFAQIIHDTHPSFFPMMINGGHGGWTSFELVQFLPSFLAINPDVRYVALSYGSNDAAGNANTAPFKSNLQQAITSLLNAGKVPVIPHIPYSCDPQHSNIPLFNQAIDQLVASNPGTLAGPDLYTYFQAHPAELSDCLHPNSTGSVSFHRLWAQAMDGLYR
jgi:chitodextrinase